MSAPRVKIVAALKKKNFQRDNVYLKLTVPTKKEKLQYLCAQTKNHSLSLKWKCDFWHILDSLSGEELYKIISLLSHAVKKLYLRSQFKACHLWITPSV